MGSSTGGQLDVRVSTTQRGGRPFALLAIDHRGLVREAAGSGGLQGAAEIARQLARASGGDTWTVNPGQDGAGRTVYVRLPLV